MHKFLTKLRYDLTDLKNFGPGVLARHLGRRRVNLRGVGPVTLRAGQSDMLCVRQVFRGREYDLSGIPAVQARLDAAYQRIIANGQVPVIVDGGANVGAAAIWFSQRYPQAHIIAVEPEAGNYAVLSENVSTWRNVLPVNAALGGEPGHVVVEGAEFGWAAQTVRSEKGVTVLTIDDCVALVPEGHQFIVKIDIEGFEEDLFHRNVGWVAETTAIAIEPHDWMLPGRFTSRNFLRAISAHDFELFILGENLIFVR